MILSNIIAGPCSADTKENLFNTVNELYNIGIRIIRVGIWKPRTKPNMFEGIGEIGLVWIKELKEKYTDLKFAIEIATPEQLNLAIKYNIDIFWIGARTTTDPFAVSNLASAIFNLPKKDKKDKTLLIKNPVCPDIDLWEGAYLRLKDCGIKNIGFIYRGFKTYKSIKYRNEPIWKIPVQLKLKYPELIMYCDPSHIAGDKIYVEEIMKEAKLYGINHFIIESHINPECALSDINQQLTPMKLNEILNDINSFNEENQNKEKLLIYRKDIDEIDNEIINLLAKRMEVSKNIGKYKKENNIEIFQPERLKALINKLKSVGKELNLTPEFIENIWMEIHDESVRNQN